MFLHGLLRRSGAGKRIEIEKVNSLASPTPLLVVASEVRTTAVFPRVFQTPIDAKFQTYSSPEAGNL